MSKYLGTNGHIYIDLSATRLFDLTDGTIINKLAAPTPGIGIGVMIIESTFVVA